MIEERILARLAARLARALAPPRVPLTRFVVDGALVGELERERVERMRAFDRVFRMSGEALTFVPALAEAEARTRAMADVARALADDGALTAWRDERYAVVPEGSPVPAFLLERSAARFFGIDTMAVHVNGSTPLPDGSAGMWLARRSPFKAIDPGLLDNLVGGGVAHGADVRATLAKEAWEEAGLAPSLVATAVPAGRLRIRRLQPDGVQRETIFVYDLDLSAGVVPVNQDGEVTAFRLARPEEVAELAGNAEGPDVVTADASLVMADWLVRKGFVGSTAEVASVVRQAHATRLSQPGIPTKITHDPEDATRPRL